MTASQPCDFCGQPVVWTPAQAALDIALRLHGSGLCEGLGVMCDACDDKQIEILMAQMEREDADDE